MRTFIFAFFGKAHFLSTSWNLVFYYKIALVFLFRAPNNPFYRIQSIVLVKDPQGRSKDQILDLVSGFPQSHSLPMSRFRLSLIDGNDLMNGKNPIGNRLIEALESPYGQIESNGFPSRPMSHPRARIRKRTHRSDFFLSSFTED